jgi:hypothetical protein
LATDVASGARRKQFSHTYDSQSFAFLRYQGA